MNDSESDKMKEDEINNEEKTEMRIDNDPDRINLSETKEKIKKNPWMLVSGVLGIVVVDNPAVTITSSIGRV